MLNRFKGSLLGLAVGDAVGTTLEFESPGSFTPITDMVGGGPFNLTAGQWTDDTSMALCLAQSLIEKGYDPKDQMDRYVRWMDEGYMSSNGVCFDIGFTTRNALSSYKDSGDPYSGDTGIRASGNGSLMRLAPVPLLYSQVDDKAIVLSGDSSRTTHGSILCVDACRYYGALIAGAVNGATKEQLLSPRFSGMFEYYWAGNPLHPDIDRIAAGSFKLVDPKGSGFVVRSLEAALWCFYNTDTFKDAVLTAANLGDDADTTAAIVGQLAGAYYGLDGIPREWVDRITMRDEIEEMASKLYELAIM